MKKIATIALVALIAGAVSADLSVTWKSQGGAVTATDGGSDYLVGSTIQLLWSAAGAVTTAGSYNLLSPGEYVLASSSTGANSLWNTGNDVYTSADIGGNDINTGFFFTRIYQNTGAAGEWFLDIAMSNGAAWDYNEQDTATIYGENVVSGVQWIGANGTTVIPEPATIGLFGLGALSAWFVRRNKKQAVEA